jgi:hypothetical protein
MNRLLRVLLPELRQFPAAEQDAALRAARKRPLDLLELVGMAAGLVAVTALTRYAVPDSGPTAWLRLALAVGNFVVAVPLLAAFLGPFHIRRLRRGLREQLQQKGRP